jgi:hypothetical protein
VLEAYSPTFLVELENLVVALGAARGGSRTLIPGLGLALGGGYGDHGSMTDLVAASAFALVGTTLLLAPASLHAATIHHIEHPFPVDSDIAFYCAGALVVLVPLAWLWSRARRLERAKWTCFAFGVATGWFWLCEIKYIFVGPWPT